MKKILIITYYWPPAGGAGVQRWLKFSKYLPQYGWQPVIYTPSNGEAPAADESLLKDVPKEVIVIKQPIWEPYSLYKKFIGQKKDEKINAGFLSESKKSSVLQKISVWIRGNFFIPDARKFWVRPSIAYLSGYLAENPVDAIVSTGPPHSMHLIALGLKKKFAHVPWLADFRDPWTQIDFYDQLMLTGWADRKHRRLELEVLKKADRVVTVSWHWADDLKKIGGRNIDVITNGYDNEDFNTDKAELVRKNFFGEKKFSFCHIGAMNKDRNPHNFWMALKELIKEVPGFSDALQIKFIGKTDYSVFESIGKNGLSAFVKRINYLPHNEIAGELLRSPLLLLPLNDTPNVLGIVPGKLFEYIAAKRPIFSIGHTGGDTARIIQETGSGTTLAFSDTKGMKREIMRLYLQYQSGQLEVHPLNIGKYSRRAGAERYSELLNEMIQI